MKKRVIVTVTKEIDVEIPDDRLTNAFREAFERSFWKLDDTDDLFRYVARCAFSEDGTQFIEGLGKASPVWSDAPNDGIHFDVSEGDYEMDVLEIPQ